jgi:hypothetical protein
MSDSRVMNIINIMQGTDLGGMEQASLRLMLGLKELGHSLQVLSLNPIGGLGPLLEPRGYRISAREGGGVSCC